jgi:hypothetical protein
MIGVVFALVIAVSSLVLAGVAAALQAYEPISTAERRCAFSSLHQTAPAVGDAKSSQPLHLSTWNVSPPPRLVALSLSDEISVSGYEPGDTAGTSNRAS